MSALISLQQHGSNQTADDEVNKYLTNLLKVYDKDNQIKPSILNCSPRHDYNKESDPSENGEGADDATDHESHTHQMK